MNHSESSKSYTSKIQLQLKSPRASQHLHRTEGLAGTRSIGLAHHPQDSRCVSEHVRPRIGWPSDPLSRIDRDVLKYFREGTDSDTGNVLQLQNQ